jgi:hypothetical protein
MHKLTAANCDSARTSCGMAKIKDSPQRRKGRKVNIYVLFFASFAVVTLMPDSL